MAKIDEIKEHISALKSYLNILTAILLAIGAGVSKLYIDNDTEILFWLGIGLMFVIIFAFAIISRSMHSHIKKLKDLP